MTLGPGLHIRRGGRFAVPAIAAALAATLLAFPGPAAASDRGHHGHHEAHKIGEVVGALLNYADGGKYYHKPYHGYESHHYKPEKHYYKEHYYHYTPRRYHHKRHYRRHFRGYGYHRGHYGGYRHRYGYGGRYHH